MTVDQVLHDFGSKRRMNGYISLYIEFSRDELKQKIRSVIGYLSSLISNEDFIFEFESENTLNRYLRLTQSEIPDLGQYIKDGLALDLEELDQVLTIKVPGSLLKKRIDEFNDSYGKKTELVFIEEEMGCIIIRRSLLPKVINEKTDVSIKIHRFEACIKQKTEIKEFFSLEGLVRLDLEIMKEFDGLLHLANIENIQNQIDKLLISKTQYLPYYCFPVVIILLLVGVYIIRKITGFDVEFDLIGVPVFSLVIGYILYLTYKILFKLTFKIKEINLNKERRTIGIDINKLLNEIKEKMLNKEWIHDRVKKYNFRYRSHTNDGSEGSFNAGDGYVEQADIYLKILNLKRGYTNQELKKAYYVAMKNCHPDLHQYADEFGRKEAENWTKRIKEAYEYLKK